MLNSNSKTKIRRRNDKKKRDDFNLNLLITIKKMLILNKSYDVVCYPKKMCLLLYKNDNVFSVCCTTIGAKSYKAKIKSYNLRMCNNALKLRKKIIEFLICNYGLVDRRHIK